MKLRVSHRPPRWSGWDPASRFAPQLFDAAHRVEGHLGKQMLEQSDVVCCLQATRGAAGRSLHGWVGAVVRVGGALLVSSRHLEQLVDDPGAAGSREACVRGGWGVEERGPGLASGFGGSRGCDLGSGSGPVFRPCERGWSGRNSRRARLCCSAVPMMRLVV